MRVVYTLSGNGVKSGERGFLRAAAEKSALRYPPLSCVIEDGLKEGCKMLLENNRLQTSSTNIVAGSLFA
jgi:predicted peroxiredoxin